MIPANYTNETFADYLKDEVLIDTAMELGWLDITTEPNIPEIQSEYDIADIQPPVSPGTGGAFGTQVQNGEGWVFLNVDSATGTTLDLAVPTIFAIPDGTPISFDYYASGEDTLIVDGDVAIGDTQITFTTSFDPDSDDAIGYFYKGIEPVVVDPEDRVQNPVYQAIINSILFQLGASNITDFSSLDSKKKLRFYGRREVWNFAMQALAADYNYGTQAGVVYRFGVYQHARTMFELENSNIINLYGGVTQEVSQLLTNTARTKIAVRW